MGPIEEVCTQIKGKVRNPPIVYIPKMELGTLISEELEVRAPDECVRIVYREESPIVIVYRGLTSAMRRTVDKLRLPKAYPTNLGDRVFYLFRNELEEARAQSTVLEQQVVPGTEKKFEMVLCKLSEIYLAQAAANATLSGGVLSCDS